MAAVVIFGAGPIDGASGDQPTMPVTPSVETIEGTEREGVREFRLTASEFEQQIANFPVKRVTVGPEKDRESSSHQAK
ncbi:MAG: hypothetical protein ACR2NA_02425 [Solirubrobacterales bacterium]